ncbi:FtsK/SpoIIIE domain-containing protein [Candidatus Poriferisocius sp.]|uniref:FtsK/SpoIIIE domain-containing protein n=1 Tax=Candidatus Poriferisocius sp. TaxID=3101276 RepID=UPI003B5C9E40
MRLFVDGPDGGREVSIIGAAPRDVRELAEILGLPEPTDGLWVEDQWVDADRRLDKAGVCDGARVGLRPGSGPDQPGWTLEVVGGLNAGHRHPVPASGLSLGRAPDADLSLTGVGLRPHHARLEWREGRIVIHIGDGPSGDREPPEPMVLAPSTPRRQGRALVQVTDAPDDRPRRQLDPQALTAGGKIAFNRPPRPEPTATPPPIPAPAQGSPRTTRATAFGWAALAGPLVVGLLMAVLYSPYMALFALLSPLMVGATWFDNRRRDRSEGQRWRRQAHAALEEFRAAASDAHRAELRRLRERHPHLGEAVRRVRQPSMRLWERRPTHPDFMALVAGHGARPFEPDLVVDGPRPAEAVAGVLDDLGPLLDAPLVVGLGPGRLLGLVGHRQVTTAIARALLIQAVAHHGPADLAVLVAADEVTAPAWTWTSWLPHLRHPAVGRDRLLAAHRQAAADITAEITEAWDRNGNAPWPQLLVVADGDQLATGRTPPLRSLLQGSAGPASGIVLADGLDQLPAATTTVLDAINANGIVDLTDAGVTVGSVLATGMSLDLARTVARKLARYDDPEQSGDRLGIADHASLISLLDLPVPDQTGTSEAAAPEGAMSEALSEAVAARWHHSTPTHGLAAPIGVDHQGLLLIDLAADGPHALVGGTTGSGKSELLRTLVVSLAVTHSPEKVNFVLVDYKGGSAFDACAGLPHVVGIVTDLDDRLAERALRCLEAELRHREEVLRRRGAADLDHYRAMQQATDQRGEPGEEPLPRLVVVIDEFATLVAELPGFVDSLVSVAQRGRSLGIHLVLATQRPAGAVNANIRTNTALRIALRVLDAADSVDVLDSPEAAAIGRHQPGRAFARFGPGELVEFQSALVTGVTAGSPGPQVVPAPDGLPVAPPKKDSAANTANENPANRPADSANEITDDIAHEIAPDSPDDLTRLAEAACTAWANGKGRPPRRPWPDPLPARVSLESLEALERRSPDPDGVAFALADDPDGQRQYPLIWDHRRSNVLFVGTPGSGTSTALGSLAVALAGRHPPGACHQYAVDSGLGELAPLRRLPHCGAVVGPAERDRIARLIRRLEGELDRRRSGGQSFPSAASGQTPAPLVVTLIDNWGGLVKSLDNVADLALLTALEWVWAEGPAVGLNLAVAADHLGQVSRAVQAATPQTYVFRLGDPALYRQWGVAVDDPGALPPGRGFAVPSGLEIHVAVPDGGLDGAIHTVAARQPPQGGPPPVGILPATVDAACLDPARLSGAPVYLPLGLSDDTLAPTGLVLHPAEHALIVGPARSGRSTALTLVAAVARGAGAHVVALAPEGSALARCPDVHVALRTTDDLVAATRSIATPLPTPLPSTVLVLIDDAETVIDHGGHLKALAADPPDGLHIVAAGNADRLRTAYGHWTAEIRFSRTGVLLQPSPLDGDLFGLQLPSRPAMASPGTMATTPGRGYLVHNAQPTVIQLAHPS